MFKGRDGLAKARGREPRVTFGPVVSKRLGTTLGVDNLRGKHCSYECSYCELGKTVNLARSRQRHYPPENVVEAARLALSEADQPIDHIAIVPGGEPALDASLGELIRGLRELGPPVAVFTNGSLLSRDDVRRELGEADWVSIKVDVADTCTWRQLNRPFEGLDFDLVFQGMRVFAASFRGRLATETMLIPGVNTSRTQLEETADLVSMVKPYSAYLTLSQGVEVDPDRARAVTRAARAIFADRLEEVVVIEPEAERPADRRIHLRQLARPLPRGERTLSDAM